MAKATVALLDYPEVPVFIVVSNGGSRAQMKRALRLACYKRRALVKFGLPAFLPHLIHQLRKCGGIVTVHMRKRPAQSHLTYNIESSKEPGDKGAIMLAISGKEYGERVSYHGPFFAWLGGQSRLRQKLNRVRGTAKQRAAAVQARIDKLRTEQTFRGQKIYTPRQLALQKQFRSIFQKHERQSNKAALRHHRKRTTPKFKLDDFPLTPGLEPAQPPARKLTVDFTGVNELDYDPDDHERDDETPNR